MSRFFSEKYIDLEPYVPGELPKNKREIKLNTNENPYPPLQEVTDAVAEESRKLNLYSDPDSLELRRALADNLEVPEDHLIVTNGSDEILNFAFMAFCDDHIPAVFPDVTYGFYPVFAQINQLPYREIPLKDDLTIDINKFLQREPPHGRGRDRLPEARRLQHGKLPEDHRNPELERTRPEGSRV